jgi:hypothetical protein
LLHDLFKRYRELDMFMLMLHLVLIEEILHGENVYVIVTWFIQKISRVGNTMWMLHLVLIEEILHGENV